MAEITITADNFDTEVANASVPVLVDFWATWCGPCKMMAPVLAEFAKKYEGSVKVGKVNVDEEDLLASRFAISSIPTLILFRDGKPAKMTMGYQPLEKLESILS